MSPEKRRGTPKQRFPYRTPAVDNRPFWQKHKTQLATAAGGALGAMGLIFANDCKPQQIPQPPGIERPQTSIPAKPTTVSSRKEELSPRLRYILAIENEIKQQQIQPSEKERALWAEGFQSTKTTVELNETTEAEARRRIEQTLSLMTRSENPYFRHAASVYQKYRQEGRTNIYPDITEKFNNEEQAVTNSSIVNNNVHFGTRMAARDILSDYSSLSLASVITHEAEHVENFIKYDDAYAHLPLIERFIHHQTRQQNNRERVAEEARGYGTQSLAFIYTQGLVRYDMTNYPFVDTVGKFLETGGRSDSPAWEAHIAQAIIRTN